jgi:hypothetical protein
MIKSQSRSAAAAAIDSAALPSRTSGSALTWSFSSAEIRRIYSVTARIAASSSRFAHLQERLAAPIDRICSCVGGAAAE